MTDATPAALPAVLIVHPDGAVARALAEEAARGGWARAEAAWDLAGALAVGPGRFDAAALDDATGPGVAEALREAGFAGPILALGGASAEVSDAMGKPFRLAEFLARLRRLLDAARAVDERSIPIGSFVFRPAARQLIGPAPDAVARLTEKEAAILVFLHDAGGAAVERQTLLSEVWGYNEQVDTHTLETHIYRLRQKIEADPARARYLVTEAGGYRLVAGAE